MSARGFKIYKTVGFNTDPTAALADVQVCVIPAHEDKTIHILSLNATGGNAADTVDFYPADAKGRTTVKTAHAQGTITVDLVGDAGVNDTLNGHVVTSSDWVLLGLDDRDFRYGWGSWQLFKILSLGGATAGTIDINTWTTTSPNNFNAATVSRASAAVGNTAYVIDSTAKQSVKVGATTVYLENPFTGNPGAPVVLGSNGQAAITHHISGTAIYVD